MDGELRTLISLYEESGQALTAAAPWLRERVSGSRASVGIVLDERVVALRTSMKEVLTQWALLVVDERPGAEARPAGAEPSALARFLRRHLLWLAGHPAGVDFDEEITELRTESSALFGSGQARRFPLGSCTEPGCTGTLHGVLTSGGDRMPGQVSCDAGHALPPRRWLQLAARAEQGAA